MSVIKDFFLLSVSFSFPNFLKHPFFVAYKDKKMTRYWSIIRESLTFFLNGHFLILKV